MFQSLPLMARRYQTSNTQSTCAQFSPQDLSKCANGVWKLIAEGTQSKVYSKGDFVLKVMKQPEEVINKYAEYGVQDISQMRWFKAKYPGKNSREAAEILIQRNADSCKRAWVHFRNECMLNYIRMDFSDELTLSFKLSDGTLDLNTSKFYIQKKATLLGDELEDLISKGKTTEAKRVLALWVEAQQLFFKKGFYDYDVMAPHKNYGVLKNNEGKVIKVVCLDVGELHNDRDTFYSELKEQRVLSDRMVFSKFLRDKNLFEFFEKMVTEVYGQFQKGTVVSRALL